MIEHCSNPECNIEYEIAGNEPSTGFCSYECWEKCNCKEPVILGRDIAEILSE